ncbi:hypothetical protein [Nonomuraea ceibae]|uniref:hypothetical protein n=1 Tax=Nonomuraea ceibae TaxID=1935170 RepID=UPI0027E1679A|nr:hypothetical protein [Nonomuraea ceibae]
MIVAILIACEIGFWVLLGLGLACRYLWKRRRLSTALLVGVPLLDVVLLTAAVIDMRGGAVADFKHGLAAAYLAYSVVFGHRTLRWADAKFHHRFAGGPPPPKPPPGGRARTLYEWRYWLLILLAYGITWAVVLLMTWLVGDPARTEELRMFALQLVRVPAIALIWPVSHTLWPKKVETEDARSA